MSDALALMLAAAAGAVLGLFFFGGLWWTLARALASPRPALWIVSSLLLRMGGSVVGFILVAAGDWRRLLVCLLGFWAARWFVVRATTAAGVSIPAALVSAHAPRP